MGRWEQKGAVGNGDDGLLHLEIKYSRHKNMEIIIRHSNFKIEYEIYQLGYGVYCAKHFAKQNN